MAAISFPFKSLDLAPGRLRVVAYHEAGHAVAGYKKGWTIESVTTIPGEDDRGTYDGLATTTKEFATADIVTHQSAAWSRVAEGMIISMAGPAAQRKFAPTSKVPSGARGDEEDIDKALALMATSYSSEMALRRFCVIEARELINRDWRSVEVLAAALIRERRLEGSRVRELLDEVAAAEAAASREYLDAHGLPDVDQVMAAFAEERRRAKGVSRRQIANSVLRTVVSHMAQGVALEPDAVISLLEIDASIADLDRNSATEKLRRMVDGQRAATEWRAAIPPHPLAGPSPAQSPMRDRVARGRASQRVRKRG
ncbi:hypothetical protein FJ970_22595 [Mesorhizobium sp. B2-1-8]|uniref:hypothetical protein n=1 Tax=Mesorhizobium sp. B2-1-8 TaxID=2589967 RepID=UPI00112673D9|nr:hypothetical protein [Mesorhizobium sp. B2-1-8]UCI17872.1 hypothetical protein FJ970_22595 [Mesorhizobium sp. B2-1-8]